MHIRFRTSPSQLQANFKPTPSQHQIISIILKTMESKQLAVSLVPSYANSQRLVENRFIILFQDLAIAPDHSS